MTRLSPYNKLEHSIQYLYFVEKEYGNSCSQMIPDSGFFVMKLYHTESKYIHPPQTLRLLPTIEVD